VPDGDLSTSQGPVFGLTLKDRALLFRQLSSMLTAGLPLSRSLTVLAEQSRSGLRGLLVGVAAHLDSGRTLSASLGAYPACFDELTVAMVRAGEVGGLLHRTLPMLADLLEEAYTLRQQLLTMLVYPVVVLHAVVLIPPVVEWVTRGLEAYLSVVVPRLGLLYGGLLALWLLELAARVLPGVRALTEYTLAWTPLVAGVVRSRALALFLRSLGSLLEGGLYGVEALEVAARGCGNAWVAQRLLPGAQLLVEAASWSAALAASGLLPREIAAMVATGEEAGQLPAMLGKAADYLKLTYQAAVQRLLGVIPVVLSLVVGFIVAREYIQTFVSIMSPLKELMP
jgi:type IV pilus assembly protein PilC